jgi:hypothetical protein
MDWQPIETAPRDGTIIDVWLRRAIKKRGFDRGTRRTCVTWVRLADGAEGWAAFDVEDDCYQFIEQDFAGILEVVTHWMPLPPPPEGVISGGA